MINNVSVAITLVGLLALFKSGYTVYSHLSSFKLQDDNIDNFSIPHMLIAQIIFCTLITFFGGSKLFLNLKNIQGDSMENFNNTDWDKCHTRRNFGSCFNRKQYIKNFIKDFVGSPM
ncbi:membrane magnesium transporter, putative [Plasmodium reichenowi]|uniref:Membrane magnesium transporter, putative n=1 Tax=Plasmodium reichenowi TaxID=5854 RepID=A0A2P9D462_PLARE|nr:membrane magnesium transporter, putative [Plasmodium reichenowi]